MRKTYLSAIQLVIDLAAELCFRATLRVLAIFSIICALVFHSALGDQNQFIHFFKNVAIAGGLLQVVAFGGGRLSLDGREVGSL